MSGEQRQKLVQRVKKLCEDAKVAIRNVRRDANKRLEQEVKTKPSARMTASVAKRRFRISPTTTKVRLRSLPIKKSRRLWSRRIGGAEEVGPVERLSLWRGKVALVASTYSFSRLA
jgi:hypothetical protein